mgnify:CR=1 FL=1
MIKGNGVSTGIGFGTVVVLRKENKQIEKNVVENPEEEMKRFKEALSKVTDETKQIVEKASGTEREIMNAYLMILQDPTLIAETGNAIMNQNYNAEYAVEVGFNNVIQIFENMDDEYMAGRARDIADIKERILAKLSNIEIVDLSQLHPNTIIVATELTTSDTAKLNFKNVVGIITEVGGENSHTSIMARTHAIPAITKVKDATKIFNDGENVALNGATGEIYQNPTQEEREKLEKIEEQITKEKAELDKYKEEVTKTGDGYVVELVANIGTPSDVEIVLKNSAEGVGLFRSEFLYMDSENMPTEEEQFNAYKEVAEKMEGRPVIIRTLDIGGDKNLKYLQLEKEANPFLGYRAIRLCLDKTSIFKTQLKAILRASAFGNLSIMLPMISSIEELREAKDIIEDVKKELEKQNIAFKKDIKIGIMVEIPSTAIMAEEFGKECDFFSIGTNDLIQYTVAVERGNEKIANLYTMYNPAVIRLIKSAIDGAHKNKIKCGMCGESAGELLYIPLLIGLGLDEFSMNANKVLKARKLILDLKYSECKKLAEDILKMPTAEEIKEKLRHWRQS